MGTARQWHLRRCCPATDPKAGSATEFVGNCSAAFGEPTNPGVRAKSNLQYCRHRSWPLVAALIDDIHSWHYPGHGGAHADLDDIAPLIENGATEGISVTKLRSCCLRGLGASTDHNGDTVQNEPKTFIAFI
jgi:hypothetical protein